MLNASAEFALKRKEREKKGKEMAAKRHLGRQSTDNKIYLRRVAEARKFKDVKRRIEGGGGEAATGGGGDDMLDESQELTEADFLAGFNAARVSGRRRSKSLDDRQSAEFAGMGRSIVSRSEP